MKPKPLTSRDYNVAFKIYMETLKKLKHKDTRENRAAFGKASRECSRVAAVCFAPIPF